MFLGEFERSLDDKGRVAIPSEFRAALGLGAVVTRSFDNCLCIYPASKWESLARAVDDLPQVRYEARALARSIFSGAVPCEFDRQGRVVIPVFLRQHADIRGDIVVAGLYSRVEIWNRDSWRREQQTFESDGPRLAEVLSVSGV